MSDFYADGNPRIWKTTKLLLNVHNLEAFQNLNHDNLTLSQLINDLLADWLMNQKLKAEFKRLEG